MSNSNIVRQTCCAELFIFRSSGTGMLGRSQNSSGATTPLHHNSAPDPSSTSVSNPFLGNAAAILHWQQRRALQLAADASARPLKDPMSPDNVGIGSPHSQYGMSKDPFGNAVCSRCGGKYTNPATCAAHELKCNGTNRLMCSICKRVYSQMCALKEHLRGKHGVGEPLICKHCGRSFKYKPQLYDHRDCVGMTNRKLGRMIRSPNYPDQVPFQEDQKF